MVKVGDKPKKKKAATRTSPRKQGDEEAHDSLADSDDGGTETP
jgi:hypothetical protein